MTARLDRARLRPYDASMARSPRTWLMAMRPLSFTAAVVPGLGGTALDAWFG